MFPLEIALPRIAMSKGEPMKTVSCAQMDPFVIVLNAMTMPREDDPERAMPESTKVLPRMETFVDPRSSTWLRSIVLLATVSRSAPTQRVGLQPSIQPLSRNSLRASVMFEDHGEN